MSTFFSGQNAQLLHKHLPEQLKLKGQWDVAFSETSYPSMFQNITEGNINYFDRKIWKSLELFNLELGPHPSITNINEAKNTLLQERHNQSQRCITIKVSPRTPKVEIYVADEGSGLWFLSMDLRHILKSISGKKLGVILKKTTPHTTNCLRHRPHTRFHDIHKLVWVQFCRRHKGSIVALFSSCFIAQGRTQYNYWTVHEQSDL